MPESASAALPRAMEGRVDHMRMILWSMVPVRARSGFFKKRRTHFLRHFAAMPVALVRTPSSCPLSARTLQSPAWWMGRSRPREKAGRVPRGCFCARGGVISCVVPDGVSRRAMRNGAWAFRCFRRDCSATSPARAPASTWAVASRWAVNLGDAGGSRSASQPGSKNAARRMPPGFRGSDAGEQVDSDDRRLYGNSPRRNRGLYSEFAQHPAQFVR